MLQYTAGHYEATITLPPSKSLYNRLLVMARLAQAEIPSEWRARPLCDDLRLMTKACSSTDPIVPVGASGTALRLLTAMLAVTTEEVRWIVTDEKRLTERPRSLLISLINQIGGSVRELDAEEGGFGSDYPLVEITPVHDRTSYDSQLYLPGKLPSSQYLTALMLVAPYLPCGLVMHLSDDVVSKPYVALTAYVMNLCGAEVELRDREIRVSTAQYDRERIAALLRHPVGDWSSAQYWLQCALMTPDYLRVHIPNIHFDSRQPDERCVDYFGLPRELMIEETGGVTFDSDLLRAALVLPRGSSVDVSGNPDFAPTLAVTLLAHRCPARLSGVAHLRYKESDRVRAMIANAERLGLELRYSEEEGVFEIGVGRISDRPVGLSSYADHRMAMVWAPWAYLHPLSLTTPECVTKSYPTYWQDLRLCGFEWV